MKINNYKLFLESTKDIEYICHKYRISNYIIHSDGTVDVDGDVNLYSKELTQLPLKFGRVTGSFDCDNNYLTSLEGSPNWVGGFLTCADNLLTTLEGGPKVVVKSYYCESNQLINFKGFPEDFDCTICFEYNPVFELLEKIPEEKRNKFIYWCNEYDAITDDGEVIPERMEEVYNKLGMVYED